MSRRGLGLQWARRGRGDVDGDRETACLEARASAVVSMRSALLLRDGLGEGGGRRTGRLLCLRVLRLRSLLFLAAGSRDSSLRRPRCSGLNEVMRRRVMRSPSRLCREPADDTESMDAERLLRFPFTSCFWRRGGGERERLARPLVEMVETESTDSDLLLLLLRLRDRLRPCLPARSSSFFLRMSSATPFLRTRSLGISVVSLGLSWGLSSCCVRDGRDL